MNDCFAANMTGKPVSFDVQPYSRGKGVTRSVTPRLVRHRDFDARRGTVMVEYEVFDLVLDITDGYHTGAFICGVPASPARDMAGKSMTLLGVTYDQLRRAVGDGTVIVIARCG